MVYNHLVAPYWVDSGIGQSGGISYEVHTSTTGLVSTVNNFIQQQRDDGFVGSWMIVATFHDIPIEDSQMVHTLATTL